MLNRRKLIQLALSEVPAETEYLDYKQEIDLTNERDRGKLIKLVAALSNSNPNGMSFVIIGVTDSKRIVGINFIDDAKFQNAIRGYLENCPKILYENIAHDSLPKDKFIGLLTIQPENSECRVLKKIWTLRPENIYYRLGTTVIEVSEYNGGDSAYRNEKDSMALVNRASVSLEATLDSLVEFYDSQHREYNPKHHVFHDQYVVGVSGYPSVRCESLTEVTVALINEDVSYFWSALESVRIERNEDTFTVLEEKLACWDKEFF